MTGLERESQLSDWLVDALAVRVQSPGPRSGTSTNSKPGCRVPESTPVSALALVAEPTRRPVEAVTAEDFVTTIGAVVVVTTGLVGVAVAVVVGGDVAIFGFDTAGTVVAGTEVGATVVAGDVEEGGRDEAAGPLGAPDEVSVKTRTSRRIGLDHINRCVLLREESVRAIVFEG